MPNPWDRPPLPKRGDEDHDITFAYVGRIMSGWESVEFELSRLHTWFAGSLDDTELMREYGAGNIFRLRADILRRKADEYFIAHPDQKREGEFSELLGRIRLYANRRNDIAHGIMFPIHKITYFRDRIKPNLLKREHYAVIPPLHANRQHSQIGLPEFAYTSAHMRPLRRRLWKIQKEAEKFRLRG